MAGRVPSSRWCSAWSAACVGGVAYERLVDRTTAAARSSGGLDGVDTVSRAAAQGDNGSVAAVAQELLPSTVQIAAEYDGQEGGATGSGFVLDRQGHVITNNHVVADAADDDGPIEVVDQDGNRYEATVVGRSPVYDLAVLYVDRAPTALQAGRRSAPRRRCASATPSSRSARRSG